MLYESTRGFSEKVTASRAIVLGLAPDRGLFVPEKFVTLSTAQIAALAQKDYRARAVEILRAYLDDFTEDELATCAGLAYGGQKFDHPAVAPVQKIAPGLYALELWHGPTLAFKDMALQLMPHLLTRAAQKTGEDATIAILVATSGDTGKAALEGFKDVPGTVIAVFYPEKGVSEVQKLQMVTQEGGNLAVIAVQGNFDDAQTGVKEIFGDTVFNAELKKYGFVLSSANSINWGRLAPQIVYYFSAYADLMTAGEIEPGEEVVYVVPTGNFGNILAAFYAKEMGLPVKKLVLAANTNNVLVDFIRTGTYDRRRQFYRTISPSMDILISSNAERLVYHASGRDGQKVKSWMEELGGGGVYRVDAGTYEVIASAFWADSATDAETLDTIRKVYTATGYIADPHTAVGLCVAEKYRRAAGDNTKAVVASTASPFKFNASVAKAVLGEEKTAGKSEFELLTLLAQATGTQVPPALNELDKKPVLHPKSIKKEEMALEVKNFLLGQVSRTR